MFKEALNGFYRSRLSTLITIWTMTIVLLFWGSFTILFLNARIVVSWIQSKVELEAFLDRSLNERDIQSSIENVKKVDGVLDVSYISKEMAAQSFKEEGFGEDIFDVLDKNPLPASLKIQLHKDVKTTKLVQNISLRLEAIDGIDEVVYQKQLLPILDRYIRIGMIVTLSIGVFIGLSAVFLVSNTIKLTIFAKRKIIRTMQFVGATDRFIRFPFILMGIMQGVVGSFAASGLIYSILYVFGKYVSNAFWMDTRIYMLLVGVGISLGWSGSILSIRRFLKIGKV